MRTDTERLDWLEENLPSFDICRASMDGTLQNVGWEISTCITNAQVAFEQDFRAAIDAAMAAEEARDE